MLTVLDHNPVAGAQHDLGRTAVPSIKSLTAWIRWFASVRTRASMKLWVN